jgi:hypothetical protein
MKTQRGRTTETRQDRPDFETCKRKFREDTILLASQFSSAIIDVWGWTKQRLSLSFVDGVMTTRHLNEPKQRSYLASGSEGIWERNSQSLLGMVREYIPSVVEVIQDGYCPNCDNMIKIYSNSNAEVAERWRAFKKVKTQQLEFCQNERVQELLALLRTARKKFKLDFSKKCYETEGDLSEEFKKENFLPELVERLGGLWIKCSDRYIEIVISNLPDMMASRSYCSVCHAEI